MDARSTDNLLEIKNLSLCFRTPRGRLKTLRNVSVDIPRKRIVGIVGESGCGKSTLISTIMRLLPGNAEITGGQIMFDGEDLLKKSEAEMRSLRGGRISMIFQDPMTSLNPVLPIGRQMIDIQHREKRSQREKRDRAAQMLARVGIPDPLTRLDNYPHQFSGGMRQRVAIATALLHSPELIIADEPTTALDVTIQAQILAEVQQLAAETGMALIWISHDLAVVSSLADRIAVMYAGRIVESGPAAGVLASPLHPYTAGLIGSVPSRNRRGAELTQIPGMTPGLLDLPEGCAFRPRCPRARDECRQPQPIRQLRPDQEARCCNPVTSTAEMLS
jgi:peptide/nickel transport system ATP-binding protein